MTYLSCKLADLAICPWPHNDCSRLRAIETQSQAKAKFLDIIELRIFKLKFIGNSFKDIILLFSPLITNFKMTSIYKLPLPVKVDHLVSNL